MAPSFKTQQIPHLGREHLDVPTPKKRPVPDGMPAVPFLSLIQGHTGCGKTTALVEMIKKYDRAKSIDFLYVYSPTFYSDDKYTLLSEGEHSYGIDVRDDFSEDQLAKTIDKIKARMEEHREWEEYSRVYKRFMRARNVDSLTPDEIVLLDAHAFEPMAPVCKHGMAPQSLIVFDDLACDERLYRPNARGVLAKFLVLSRHHNCGLIFMLQTFKGSLNKSLRNNLNTLMLYRNRSPSIKAGIAEEFASYVSPERFTEMWDWATEEPHSFFLVDLRDRERMFRRNFNEVIVLSDTER